MHLGSRVFATPYARKLAAEKGIEVSSVRGTGLRGRVLAADVNEFTPSQQQQTPAHVEMVGASPEDFEPIPVSRMRKV